MNVALRQLRAEDIVQVVEIEQEAFTPLWIGTPFKRELNNRYARYLVAYCQAEPCGVAQPSAKEEPKPADASLWGRVVRGVQGVVRREQEVVVKSDSYIAGYVGIWFQGNEGHITEIAVREKLRGNGIGELLLIGSLRAAIEYGCSVVTLEARVSNFIAQRLYEKYGFKSAGIRKGYYSDNREDAVIMTTSPIHSEEYQRRFQQLQEAYLARWREIYIEA
jgi:ribosomal-protein-alanine N-acetyltransferase